MLLKDVRIQNGIAFLEPAKVVMKGWKTEELEEVQDADFVRSLRLRLGYVSGLPPFWKLALYAAFFR